MATYNCMVFVQTDANHVNETTLKVTNPTGSMFFVAANGDTRARLLYFTHEDPNLNETNAPSIITITDGGIKPELAGTKWKWGAVETLSPTKRSSTFRVTYHVEQSLESQLGSFVDHTFTERIDKLTEEQKALITKIAGAHVNKYRKSMNVVSLLKGIAIGFLIASIFIVLL